MNTKKKTAETITRLCELLKDVAYATEELRTLAEEDNDDFLLWAVGEVKKHGMKQIDAMLAVEMKRLTELESRETKDKLLN